MEGRATQSGTHGKRNEARREPLQRDCQQTFATHLKSQQIQRDTGRGRRRTHG